MSAPLENYQESSQYLKSHQRSFSAPTFWPIMSDPNMPEQRIEGSQLDEPSFNSLRHVVSSISDAPGHREGLIFTSTPPASLTRNNNESNQIANAATHSLYQSLPAQSESLLIHNAFDTRNSDINRSAGSLKTPTSLPQVQQDNNNSNDTDRAIDDSDSKKLPDHLQISRTSSALKLTNSTIDPSARSHTRATARPQVERNTGNSNYIEGAVNNSISKKLTGHTQTSSAGSPFNLRSSDNDRSAESLSIATALPQNMDNSNRIESSVSNSPSQHASFRHPRYSRSFNALDPSKPAIDGSAGSLSTTTDIPHAEFNNNNKFESHVTSSIYQQNSVSQARNSYINNEFNLVNSASDSSIESRLTTTAGRHAERIDNNSNQPEISVTNSLYQPLSGVGHSSGDRHGFGLRSSAMDTSTGSLSRTTRPQADQSNDELYPDKIGVTDSLHQSIPTRTHNSHVNNGFELSNSGMDNFTGSLSMSGPRAEPTPPLSQHPDHPSPNNNDVTYSTPDTPPVTQGDTGDVSCMFVSACNTGSQLRKAISHILGRNKLCTRQIPREIWVHFCRKHYQRSRYRNPKEYSKLQCDLVQKQIRRIHEWSKNNAAAGRPGVVVDWELTIRKREQKRLDELSSTNRKRRSTTFEQDEDIEDVDDDDTSIAASHRSSHVLTAVPQWLLGCCRKGYTTREILEVFNRLHTEVLTDRISHFPDIEILPNITSDEAPKSPKGYTKRSSSTAVHRRTQSLGAATLQSTSSSPVNRSYGSVWGDDQTQHEKRRRSNGQIEDTFEDRTASRSRHVENSPMDTTRRMTQFSHRPVFAGIQENYIEERYGETQYNNSPLSYQNPLPAPIPQRSGGHFMATNLENHGYTQNSHGSLHGRSRSDMGAFNRAPVSPGMGTYQTRQFGIAPTFNQVQFPRTEYRGEPSRWSDSRANEPHAHQHYQSTPTSYDTPPSTCNRQVQLPYHPPPQNYNLPFASPRRVSETDETRNLYSARR